MKSFVFVIGLFCRGRIISGYILGREKWERASHSLLSAKQASQMSTIYLYLHERKIETWTLVHRDDTILNTTEVLKLVKQENDQENVFIWTRKAREAAKEKFFYKKWSFQNSKYLYCDVSMDCADLFITEWNRNHYQWFDSLKNLR